MHDLALLGRPVGLILKDRKETVTVAESAAGGLIAAALLAVEGASAYFLGGTVLYTWDARKALLGLAPADLPGIRPSSEPYVRAIAAAQRARFGATWAIAESGATGPAPNRYGDAAGHCCFAVDGPVAAALTLETGSGDRVGNMWAFTAAALDLLAQSIRKAGSTR
ncbi:MAG: CinA family protein [Alphaproteobacteria bacterium]|nr:CinA family protein [Alphaproteobacteria bacterium]